MHRRPRIAIVVKYYVPLRRISGIVNYLAALAPRLAERAEVHVVTWRPRTERQASFELDGYVVHRVAAPFPWRAGKTVARLRPDATLIVSGIYDLPRAAAYFAVVGFRAGRGTGRRAFYQATHLSAGAPHVLDRLLRRYDEIICADAATALELSQRHPKEATVVPPGIDLRALRSVTSATRASRYRVGFVNHLNHVKGADLALAAFERIAHRVPDADFVVAGDGDLGPALRAQYATHDAFEFYGFLDDDARLELMASCDVVVLPFRTAVSVLGVSQTVLECMALGTVVVGSHSAAIAPAISRGVEGELFDDPDELDDLVVELLLDGDRRARLVDGARRRVAQYDVADRANQLLCLLAPA